MTTSRLFLAGFLLLFLYACKQPLAIVGEGDILSDSGNRDCTLADFQASSPNCTDNEILGPGDYVETYTGVPKPGWQFRRWSSYCRKSLDNTCSFNIPGSLVEQYEGFTLSPLEAVFRSTTNTGFVSVFMGNELFDPIAQGIEAHAINAGYTDHTTATFLAAGDLGAPQAFWDDTVARANIQAELDNGDVELFGMTWSAAYPSVDGYRLWVDYALAQHADTRFFISVPWSDDPEGGTNEDYEAAYEANQAAVHSLINQLRGYYPGVDFYSVPLGRAAVELYHLYDDANLPDVSTLVGGPAVAVFQDSAGTPGDILVELGELVWLGALYDVDLNGYSYNPGYITDLKALAQSIMDAHDPDYIAPDEVDVDTDGDGIVDRLDPNPLGRPNVLLVMVDDMGFNDLAINNGNTNIDTPNLDQFAQDGVRFTRHYANPVCNPARAALLTGMYPERLGYVPNSRGITPEVVTLPERLQEESYTTWHLGKWHLGEQELGAWPDAQGFDHWFGFLTQSFLPGVHEQGELTYSIPRYENPWLQGDTEPGAYFTGHLEDIITDKAIEVIDDVHGEGAPWFVNLWYYAPHSPISPSAAFAALYPDTDEGRYQALVNQLDFNIGRVVDHLDTLGALDDTIVVIVSDNGGTNLEIDNNSPYWGKKNALFEGSLRTPLLMLFPDGAVNGQVIADTISIQDIYPTLLSAAGITVPGDLDGSDFYPTIELAQAAPQRDLYWEHGEDSYGVLSADGQYRYLQRPVTFGVLPDPLLYDLVADPTGTFPVIPIPPALQTQLVDGYKTWYRDAHTVPTIYTPDAFGGGELTSADYLRAPGFGRYTFGVGVPTGYSGPLVTQTGAWSMDRSGNTVTAYLGPATLSGDIVAVQACHSVVVTGYFRKKLAVFSPPDNIALSLYIDGVEVDTVDMEGTLAVADFSESTYIGDPLATSHMGTFLNPVALSDSLDPNTPWTIGDFSQDLCTP